MAKPAPHARLQKGDARVELRVHAKSALTTGDNVVKVVSWPDGAILEEHSAGRMKEARKVFRKLLALRLADGYVEATEPWGKPPVAPPAERDLASNQRIVDVAELDRLAGAWISGAGVDTDSFDRVLVYDGDVSGDDFAVDYPDGCVFVSGDVRVTGLVSDWEGALLIVAGHVECERAILSGQFACRGDLVAKEFVYVNSGNDYSFTTFGTLRAPVFVEGGMASYAESFEAEVWRTMNQVSTTRHGERYDYPKVPAEERTRERLIELGLSQAAASELVALV